MKQETLNEIIETLCNEGLGVYVGKQKTGCTATLGRDCSITDYIVISHRLLQKLPVKNIIQRSNSITIVLQDSNFCIHLV